MIAVASGTDVTWRKVLQAVQARAVFRVIVVACQAAGLVISWPLWQAHDLPPMLPALGLPAVPMGVPLLGSLLLVLARPFLGTIVHTALLVYAMAIDQTRIQPEFVSLMFLLWGALPSPDARLVARSHLIALWFFAGLNKLFSPVFFTSTAPWMLAGYGLGLPSPLFGPGPPSPLYGAFGYVVVASEISLAVLSLVPATRRLAAVWICLVHLNIVYILSPLGHDWNQVVWPWNIALAVSGFFLIGGWRESLVTSVRQASVPIRLLVVVLLLTPAGFYALVTDAYLAHNLYSSNTPVETWCHAGGGCIAGEQTSATWKAFNVPLPPEPRLFEAYFAKTCQPGDRLTIQDTRLAARAWQRDRQTIACPAGS